MNNKSKITEELDLESYQFNQSQSQSFSVSKKKNTLLPQAVPEETLQKILTWRKDHEAPVDIVGCERLADKKAPIEVQKYQTLVSLMLSIQTKD